MGTHISAISACARHVQGFLVASMDQDPQSLETLFISSCVHFDLPSSL